MSIHYIPWVTVDRQQFSTLDSVKVLERHVEAIVVSEVRDSTEVLAMLQGGDCTGFLIYKKQTSL